MSLLKAVAVVITHTWPSENDALLVRGVRKLGDGQYESLPQI